VDAHSVFGRSPVREGMKGEHGYSAAFQTKPCVVSGVAPCGSERATEIV